MSDVYLDRNGEVKRRNEGRMQLNIARPSEGAPPKSDAPRDPMKGGWFQASDARELIARGMERKDGPDGGELVELKHTRAWLKGGRLGLEAAVRHGFKQRILRRDFPRIAEFHNLGWLRAAGLPAPKPLVGCVWRLGLRARAQFSASEWIEDAPSVAAIVQDAEGRDGTAVEGALHAAGATIARMHAAGFAHLNCFPRNFVVDAAGTAWILDAWRGGPRKGAGPGAQQSAWARADVADFEARLRELGQDPAPFRAGYAQG